jgi:hypothetical protein
MQNYSPGGLSVRAVYKRKSLYDFLGDPSERVPAVPIPNREVKPVSPDGTARASVRESRARRIKRTNSPASKFKQEP